MLYVIVKNMVVIPAKDNATALNSNGFIHGTKLNNPQANLPIAFDNPKTVINMTARFEFMWPSCIEASTMYKYGINTPRVDIKELNAKIKNDGEHIMEQSNIVASVLLMEIGQHTQGKYSSA